VHSQALFANAQYIDAARILRGALEKAPLDTPGLFYAKYLYLESNVLTQQIEKLDHAAQAEPENADMQLLLGYQLMAVGKYEQSLSALGKAQPDETNTKTAEMLIGLMEQQEKIKY
jgi:tetratricopeptide (TPR) repeat protein